MMIMCRSSFSPCWSVRIIEFHPTTQSNIRISNIQPIYLYIHKSRVHIHRLGHMMIYSLYTNTYTPNYILLLYSYIMMNKTRKNYFTHTHIHTPIYIYYTIHDATTRGGSSMEFVLRIDVVASGRKRINQNVRTTGISGGWKWPHGRDEHTLIL